MFFFLQRVDYPRWLLFLFLPLCCLIRKGHPSLVLMPASPHKQHSTNSCPSPILLMMGILFSWTNMSLISNDKDPLYSTPFSDLIRFPLTFFFGGGGFHSNFFLLAVNLTRGGGYFTISNKILYPFPVLISFDGFPRLDN